MWINSVSAQTAIWSVDASKYVNKLVSFDELAYLVKYNAYSKVCAISLADPDVKKSPVITVIIHKGLNSKKIAWLRALDGHTIHVSGRLLYKNNRFEINGDDSNTKIKPEEIQSTYDPAPINMPLPDTAKAIKAAN
jgi:hypothetical protein